MTDTTMGDHNNITEVTLSIKTWIQWKMTDMGETTKTWITGEETTEALHTTQDGSYLVREMSKGAQDEENT